MTQIPLLWQTTFMRTLLVLLFSFFCFLSNAQQFEVSVAGGVGQYRLWKKDPWSRFGGTRLSTMASVLYKQNFAENGEENPNVQFGVGMTYLTYGSNFSISGSEKIAPPRGYYDSYVHVIGFEFTPFIFKIGKGLNIRTGLFFGGVVHKEFEGRTVFTKIESFNGNYYGGESTTNYLTKGTVSNFVIHWNTRMSYLFGKGKLRMGPFAQFSGGLTKEVHSIERQPISMRFLGGITFEF